MKRGRGFTLVEMLVVIAILVILMAGLAMLIKGLTNKAKNEATQAMIKNLTDACENYRETFGGYPLPTGVTVGAKCLHEHLGCAWYSGTYTGGPSVTHEPFLLFHTRWLEGYPADVYPNPPRNIVDMWGNPITYRNPGTNNPRSVDIWSNGADGVGGTADDLTNWDKLSN